MIDFNDRVWFLFIDNLKVKTWIKIIFQLIRWKETRYKKYQYNLKGFIGMNELEDPFISMGLASTKKEI